MRASLKLIEPTVMRFHAIRDQIKPSVWLKLDTYCVCTTRIARTAENILHKVQFFYFALIDIVA